MNQQNKKTTKQYISLLLITHNEEENIKKNFDWLDKCPEINEIVIVDNNSTDNTQKILKSLETKERKIEILNRGLENNFSTQRNFGLSKTSNNWILWLDADEKPNRQLINFLNNFNFKTNKAFSFKRNDTFLGHELKHGETANNIFIRLFNKNFGKFTGKVHEFWDTNQPIIKTNLIINHYPSQTLNQFLKKINFYTDLRAQELFEAKVKVNLFQIIFYPLAKFVQNYIFRLGFLDSTPGIIIALSMSFHSFLVRAKLWHLSQK